MLARGVVRAPSLSALLDGNHGLSAVPFTCQTWDFLKLPNGFETSALFSVFDDLKTVSVELRHAVEIGG